MDKSNENAELTNVLQSSNNPTSAITSPSKLNLSPSLSGRTDVGEHIYAPTEYLAEFLSAIMIKDYTNALKYCTLILEYEPDNATAGQFHPLILEKLKKLESPLTSEDDESNNQASTDSDDVDWENNITTNILVSSDSDDEMSNYSSNASESEYSNTSNSSDDMGSELDINSNNTIHSRLSDSSANTTHAYSSLLPEQKEDYAELPPVYVNKNIWNSLVLTDFNDAVNDCYISTLCSDSEPPTEALTQNIAAILRSKCVPKFTDI